VRGPDAGDTLLWLIRHPEPAASMRGICYGSLDVPLSERGVEQAQSIAMALEREPLDAIYSSPLLRCVETASRVASTHGLAAQTVDALRELDFGELEGCAYEEIANRYSDVYRRWMEHPTDLQFPGGESFRQMSDRVTAVTRRLLVEHRGESLAFVTHGGVIRAILADVLGIMPENIFRIAQHYGAINRIRYMGDVPIVELMNWTSGS
jgi:alpha-ribazole phosphatase